MRKLITAGLLFAAAVASAQNIRPEALRAHMAFLASDLLEGRGTGTRGYDLAAEYVAAQFDRYGLEPGAGKSYFQRVPFLKTTPVIDGSSITITSEGGPGYTAKLTEGFMSVGDPLRETATLNNVPMVFAGFGVTAPGVKYDDYAGLDVRGKVVVVLSGGPPTMPSDLRAHYSASATKVDNAAGRGAVGMLLVTTPDDELTYPWDRLVRQQKLGGMFWLNAQGQAHGPRRELAAPHMPVARATAEALFAGAPVSLADAFKAAKESKVKGFPLKPRVSLTLRTNHEKIESPNVVGILRGSDPKLRDEYIVYSTHLDHLGITDPVNGDSINNGALDNASGVAAILEIARAMGELATKPKRSVLFLATTAEERGLRGADYFANNPTVPAKSLVANINIDEILMFAPLRDVVPIGAEHSTIDDAVKKIAARRKMQLSPDPFPEEVIFVRSDQYPFVKRGVPAVFLIAGYKAVDPNVDLMKKQLDWLKVRYHTPADDMSQPMDFRAGVQVTEFGLDLGLELANSATRVAWKKGDFFGETFGR